MVIAAVGKWLQRISATALWFVTVCSFILWQFLCSLWSYYLGMAYKGLTEFPWFSGSVREISEPSTP